MDNRSLKTNEKPLLTIVRWLGTIISIGVMIYLVSRVGWRQALESFGQIPWWYFAIFILLGLVSRFMTFARWHSLLRASEEPIKPEESLKLTFAGLFASNVLPTTIGGDVFRLAGAIRLGMSTSLATASLVVDRLVGMTGMLLALPFAIKFLPFLRDSSSTTSLGMAVGTGTLAKVWGWLRRYLDKVLQSLKNWLKQPKSLLQALGFTLIHQACIYLIIKIFINAMGEDLSFMSIAGIWSVTYFITLLPISINGLGLQEVTVTNLFSVWGGVSVETSIALAIFLRILWMLVSLPGAFFIGDVLAGKRPIKHSDPDATSHKELNN
ncbi:MAG: flippase-like domain-containing protein [Chloroflexi bacterium]|nr:flippase-like domain-containing protein [Chloroflexota bacterium]